MLLILYIVPRMVVRVSKLIFNPHCRMFVMNDKAIVDQTLDI